mgnify:CR=1 FL=1
MPTDNTPTKEQLEHGLQSLLQANKHARNKGAELFDWLKNSFQVAGRVSHITEDRQCGNRVSEQFRYKPDVVVFLCDDCVKEESLLSYIQRNLYSNIRAVLVVANRTPFAYRKLYVGKRMSNFAHWCIETLQLQPINLFQGSTDGNAIDSKQVIFYGAPGTGKSFAIDAAIDRDELLSIRTTFHPDSDYSTFVGSYKPQMEYDTFQSVIKAGHKDSQGTISTKDELITGRHIIYEFSPQAFIKAYLLAWEQLTKGIDGTPVALVIEEINRGNCAQIFGDLFQLLDRDEDGYSNYPIDADDDLVRFISPLFKSWHVDELPCPEKMKKADWDMVKIGKKLAIPANLYLWGTMNTSDQSLFPIDSAFKRRWDWQYVPIAKPKEAEWKDRVVFANGKAYDWWEFLEKANRQIFDTTKSEDKQLGYFFVKAPDSTGHIKAEQFTGKVLFYLYNDVFKDYTLPAELFGDGMSGSTKYEFKMFFDEHGETKEDVVAAFLDQLKVPSTTLDDTAADTTEPAPAE